MSLMFALGMTTRGLQSVENKISINAQNITNADKPGYTRKTVVDRYVTSNAGTAPIYGNIQGTVDRFLTSAVVDDASLLGYRNVIAQYLDLYGKNYGSTDGATTLSGYLNSFYSTMQALSTSAEIGASKAGVISIASNMSNALRNLSEDIQNQRLQADKKIEEVIGTINTSISRIAELNDAVVGSDLNDAGKAEYEDQRLYELEQLGQELDIQYFFDSNNRVQIYTGGGQPLLLNNPKTITYQSSTAVNGSTVYPAGFNAIDLNGIDLTTLLDSGQLGGLIELRDEILVNEQAKLDEFAIQLRDNVNAIVNSGSSLPPPTTMTGTLGGLTAGTAFAATGTVRVGIVDNNGLVVNYTDVNLGGMTTINDVLTALNAIPNINASLNPNGELVVASTLAGAGVAINQMTSDVTASGRTFSHYFGLNDLFEGVGAETLDVTDAFRNNNDLLPVGVFSNAVGLVAGDRGVARGDGSIADAVADMLVTNVAFNAAGNFASQSSTLKSYIQAIMANAASQAEIAQSEADTAATVYQQTKDVLSNKTGVNIDEETARMVELQAKYEASARMVATIRDMFASLLDAVR